MDFTYPPKDEMRVRIEKIKNLCEKEKDSFLARMFASPDPHDKTVVFDYIDDEWIDTVHGKIQSVALFLPGHRFSGGVYHLVMVL